MNAKRMLMHWLMLAFVLLVLVLVMLWPVSVPGHFQAGLNAFGRGEYETACREWLLSAEQGDADARHN